MTDKPRPTTLYRFWGADDVLLYVGITNRMPRRLHEHEGNKPWYLTAVRVTMEHFPSRENALDAEKRAIRAERPRFNVQHNTERGPSEGPPAGQWRFASRRSGHVRDTDLWLYPELDCSSMVDDVYELDGEGQLEEYVRYLRRKHPDWLDADAVPIYWTVNGRGTMEIAPFSNYDFGSGPQEDFLSSYTWPQDCRTGDPVDWYRLPVVNDRFPAFAEALGWLPAPFQATCPLSSILRSRDALRPLRTPRKKITDD